MNARDHRFPNIVYHLTSEESRHKHLDLAFNKLLARFILARPILACI